jgi:hypothetical protein
MSALPPPPPTPILMAQDQSQELPPVMPILVIFNLNNPIFANGATTTAEGYVTYAELPHVYGGGLRNGLPQGYGIQKNAQSGNAYEGGWKDGKAHGYGVFYWANGDRYEGGWKTGLQHGYGEVTGTLGGTPTRMEAEYKDGVRI